MPDSAMLHGDYFSYLRSRSRLGLIYRRWWLYPRLVRQLHGRVLDIGCGVGDMLMFRPGTVGSDINIQAVNWIRNCGLEAHLIVDGHLPFDDNSFDGVILDNVLEHILDPVPLLGEAARVLKPGGRLLAGVPGWKGYLRDPDHKIFLDEAGLKACTSSAGFAPEKFFHMPLPLAFLGRWISQHCLYGVFVKPRVSPPAVRESAAQPSDLKLK